MKKILLFLILIMGNKNYCFAQKDNIELHTNPNFYVILSSKGDTSFTHNFIIDPNLIKSLQILSLQEFHSKYNNYKNLSAKTYYEINLKPNIYLQSKIEIYKAFKIKVQNYQYPIRIDGISYTNTKDFLANKKDLVSVLVNEKTKTIEITTAFYDAKQKSNNLKTNSLIMKSEQSNKSGRIPGIINNN